MKDLIVIPSHISGLSFLKNLLSSFGTGAAYPILIVINEFTPEVAPLFEEVIAPFKDSLPISVAYLESNSFELGGLYAAYHQTSAENFFLLPHSCELRDKTLFDLVFKTYEGKSVAYFLKYQSASWKMPFKHWNAHVGKYRREVLEKIDFEKYLPRDIYQATMDSELVFTHAYHEADPSTVAICDNDMSEGELIPKFGKNRRKISTRYLIKWKSHWSIIMIFRDLFKRSPWRALWAMLRFTQELAKSGRRALRYGVFVVKEGSYSRLPPSLARVFSGWGWHPNYFSFRKAARQKPWLFERKRKTVENLRYSRPVIDFFRFEGEQRQYCHDLTSDSVVVDIGAYTGDWTAVMHRLYSPRLFSFEPIPSFYYQLKERFKDHPRIEVFNYALGERDEKKPMAVRGMGSSFFRHGKKEVVSVKDIAEVFEDLPFAEVDLLKLNIEGAEYLLLERMLQKDLLKRCRTLLIQFHDFTIPRQEAMAWRESLIRRIEVTHRPEMSFPFVWEAWKRKEPKPLARDYRSQAGEKSIPEISPLPEPQPTHWA